MCRRRRNDDEVSIHILVYHFNAKKSRYLKKDFTFIIKKIKRKIRKVVKLVLNTQPGLNFL